MIFENSTLQERLMDLEKDLQQVRLTANKSAL
jgi:hypothetical protein